MDKVTYTYSQLSSHSVEYLVTKHYGMPTSISCKFYVLGLHDNYLIESNSGKYILRIYRNDWRSQEEIDFELELLAFLGDKTSLVASPLRTKSGELVFCVDSPEGRRAATLFRYADGIAPGNEISVEESALLGNAVGNIHHITETFHTLHSRPVLDIPYLLDESLIAIEPYVTAELWTYLKALQNKLQHVLLPLGKKQGLFGICIGDVSPTNFHINSKRQLSLFDFDQCGNGYRAFEIGKFISSIHSIKIKSDLAMAFIEGYQQVRQLSQEEVNAIPYFEIVSVIWVRAIHVYNVDRIGHKMLEKPFWDRCLVKLKELDSVLSYKKITT